MDDLRKSLAAKNIAPAYVLVGDDPFLLVTWIDALRRAVVGASADAWNSETLEAPDATAERILAGARTVPMLGGRRLVLVRNAQALKPDDQARIAAYLAAPAPTTTLVLVAETLDGRSKLATEARRLGFLHRAEPLKERDARAFVQSRAQERRMKLDSGAVQVLVDSIGADASALDDALERLALYLGGAERAVSAEDVSACVSPARQATVFALIDALATGDARGALSALGSLLRDREPALVILWWLSRHIRQLALARTFRSPVDVAGALGVPPFVAEKLLRQSGAWSERAIRSGLLLLAQADLDLKGSKLPESLLLESLVLQLARSARRQTGGRGATTDARRRG